MGFDLSGAIKKCKCINNLMLILPFQLATLLKTRLRHGCFLVSLLIFSACNFIKIETPAQVFSSEFWEIFQPATLLRGDSDTGVFPWILQTFLRTVIMKNFCKKLNNYFLKISIYLFKVLSEPKKNDHITAILTWLDTNPAIFKKAVIFKNSKNLPHILQLSLIFSEMFYKSK